MKESDVYRLCNNIKIREEKFGGLVYDRRTDEIRWVNQTAFEILRLINGKNKLTDVFNVLTEKYNIDSKRLKTEMLALINELIGDKIIEKLRK